MAGTASFSSSSFFSYRWKYDVFLSFRGADTRYGFTGNLYEALRDKGIGTFFDDDELQRGDEITPALLNAIEESRIAIPIFSQNYASSSFCLDELVHIIDCIKGEGRLVIPVFYDVNPSHVRYQTDSYGEALAKHVERLKDNMERLEKWKMALKQAANLSGEHFELGNKKYEHEFIKKIVNVISNKINRAPLHVADYPVGLDSRVLKVNSLLDIGSDDGVHMVGIYGIGGIGKTTLARAVYNFIADKFEGLCFLDDVRENSIKQGIVHLQETILSEIVGEKNIKLGSVSKGISIIKRRLHQKKVLLILDDVDELEQLRAIVGGLDWFGSGSRVIITTRDKHLLASHGVERKYELEVLNEKEALELLSWNTFKSDKVDPSCMDILNQAVTYASGLPLALEAMGSNLFGKRLEEWESALEQYERIPNEKIQKILKVSFDALPEEEQEIFLDIACCFRGYGLAEVEDILRAHYGVCKKYGIGVLVDKSLIKIIDDRVTLHDLIKDMGREIVRQESPKKPGKRSRLWCLEDIVQVLENNTGTSDIEVINMDFPKFEGEVKWDGEAFKKMENLKTLIIRNGRFSEGPKHLPNSLRVLIWWEYPSEYLPSDFHLKKLVILEMSCSHLTSPGLLEMWKKFVNLRVLKFDDCEFITEIPNVSGVPTLEELTFRHCENLIKIHESIGFLDKLRILNVEGCSKLRSFPPIKLISLENLQLSFCSSLESFPEILGKMENITDLIVSDTPIKELPFSIQNLTGLEHLSLSISQIIPLLRSIVMLPKLYSLQVLECDVLGSSKQDEGEEQVSLMVSSNAESRTFNSLTFDDCNVSDEFIPIILTYFSNVKDLDLSGCNFTILPACIKECSFLRKLNLNSCKLLREIEGIPPNIEFFYAIGCPSLTSSSKSMLLNKELHEVGGDKKFYLDGTRIPEWFEHRSRELPISFWFRNKIPAISLCAVVEVVDKQYKCLSYIELKLFVNSIKDLSLGQRFILPLYAEDHVHIYDNKQIKSEDNEWNHVLFNLKVSEDLVIKQSGFHVFKQSSMEDIQFTDPLGLDEEYRLFMQLQKKWASLEAHVEQGSERLSLLPPPPLKSLNDNVNWDSNLMASSTPGVQGCEDSHIVTLDKETNELYSSPKVISDTDSIMSSCNRDIDSGNGGLLGQQHLTFMDKQNFDGYESVNKAKGKEMVSLAVACNSNVGEDNVISSLMQQLSMTKDLEAEQFADHPLEPVEEPIRQSPQDSANLAIANSLQRLETVNPPESQTSLALAAVIVSSPFSTETRTVEALEKIPIPPGIEGSSRSDKVNPVQILIEKFDMETLMAEFSLIDPPPSPPANLIVAMPEDTEDMEVDLDELITMLSGGYRSSPQSARSLTQLGQDSSDSHITGLLTELKNAFTYSFEHVISDQPLQERMVAIVNELEPLAQQLPITSRTLSMTVKDFLKSLTAKMPVIRRVIPAYTKEIQEKSRILKQLTDAKNENVTLKENLVKGKAKKEKLDKEIEDLEKKLEVARLRNQKLQMALQQGATRQQSIANNTKQWAVEAKIVLAKINSLEAEYQAACSDKQSLEDSWGVLQKF